MGETWAPTRLSEDEERDFRRWYAEWASQAGINPNPDDPRQLYDYRGAFKEGIEPTLAPDGKLHWPSKTRSGKWLKAPDHPTKWKEDFIQQHGVDPDADDVPTLDRLDPSAAQGMTTSTGRVRRFR